jgi:hypothetical protein
MKGSITYEEAWNTTGENRKNIRDFIKKVRKAEAGGG